MNPAATNTDLFNDILPPCYHCGGTGIFVQIIIDGPAFSGAEGMVLRCDTCTFETIDQTISEYNQDYQKKCWSRGIPEGIVSGSSGKEMTPDQYYTYMETYFPSRKISRPQIK